MNTCPQCKQAIRHAPRSSMDHRRFFGVIAALFHHWPEHHDFQPDDAEHLRKWLLVKAGYRTATFIPIECESTDTRMVVRSIEAAVRAADDHCFLRQHGSGVAVFKAKSISWDKLDQKQFNAVRNAVEEVIKAETGLDPDALLKQMEAAA